MNEEKVKKIIAAELFNIKDSLIEGLTGPYPYRGTIMIYELSH